MALGRVVPVDARSLDPVEGTVTRQVARDVVQVEHVTARAVDAEQRRMRAFGANRHEVRERARRRPPGLLRVFDLADPDAQASSIVAASRITAKGSDTPTARSTRANRRATSNECPPRSKKLSATLVTGTPNTLSQILVSSDSSASRGAIRTTSVGETSIGGGNDLRSVLPLGVSGTAGIAIHAVGTISFGSLV